MPNLTDAQKTCPHVFVGRADGVHCTRCGLHLTAQQYHELLHPPKPQAATEQPQAKPKRTRKKKEATTSE